MHPFLRQQASIRLRLAMHGLHEAERQDLRISIAVVDAAGRPIHSAHMDRVPCNPATSP